MNDGQEGGTPPAEATLGDNSAARYEQIKDGFRRLRRIDELKARLNEKAEKIRANLEKDAGVNRGALADVGRLSKLSPAAIRAKEESRSELFALLIKPKLDAADEADAEEEEAGASGEAGA